MSLSANTRVCALPAPLELDARKLPSDGAKAALTVRAPRASKLNAQLGVAVGTVTLQLAAPLVSVTVPAGDPAPGALTLSAKLKLVGVLMRLRDGPDTLIDVAAALTWCGTLALTLSAKAVLAAV